MDLNEAYCWKQFLEGDQSAFERIYFQFVNALYDYGLRISKNESLVEDCLQDLFSDLWEKRNVLSQVNSVKAYLFVAMKRRVLRKLTSENIRSFQHLDEFTAHVSPFLPTLDEEEDEEMIAGLKKAFLQLSDKQLEVIYLRYYNHLSYEEVAEIMEVQVKAVYKLMGRAIKTLKSTLDKPMHTANLLVILATMF
ncbi:sigma-70 family RNA polymerase sigma factor [Catalinimonas sp. 4WD22]|uniref:RNA polymerase sigma factor n=1 Tax=Catalinimonas locisalis TaxID=3133978 RepID=UPI003100FE8C